MKGHLNNALNLNLRPMRIPEISWRWHLIVADDLESSIHDDWLSFKFQNFTALSVRKLMRIFHWSIQMKFCKINLSEKSFQVILQCSEENENFSYIKEVV